MKSRNYHYHGDAATVQRLKEEYEYIGRYCQVIDKKHLIVFALPPKKVKKKNDSGTRSSGAKKQDRTQASRS